MELIILTTFVATLHETLALEAHGGTGGTCQKKKCIPGGLTPPLEKRERKERSGGVAPRLSPTTDAFWATCTLLGPIVMHLLHIIDSIYLYLLSKHQRRSAAVTLFCGLRQSGACGLGCSSFLRQLAPTAPGSHPHRPLFPLRLSPLVIRHSKRAVWGVGTVGVGTVGVGGWLGGYWAATGRLLSYKRSFESPFDLSPRPRPSPTPLATSKMASSSTFPVPVPSRTAQPNFGKLLIIVCQAPSALCGSPTDRSPI